MKKIAVIYWSKTGNTEKMAKSILLGLQAGGTEAFLFRVNEVGVSVVVAEKSTSFIASSKVNEVDVSSIDSFDGFIFGCPAMGKEVLEEKEFEPFFRSVEARLKGKPVALFGAYGWGDGRWMRDWEARTISNDAKLFEKGLTLQTENPIAAKIKRLFGKDKKLDEAACREFGKRFAESISSK